MTPVLINTDANYSNNLTKGRKIHLEDLNEILNEYNSLNLEAITGVEFQNLIYDPKSVIFDKINNGSPIEIGGVPINKAKALELVAMPQGFGVLNSLIESFKNSRPNWAPLLVNIDIDETGVILKQSVIDADIEAGKTYVTTAEEKALFDFLTAVISAAGTYFGSRKYDLGDLVSSGIFTNTEPGVAEKYKINYKKIKGFGLPH
jgi:hypothetical protein